MTLFCAWAFTALRVFVLIGTVIIICTMLDVIWVLQQSNAAFSAAAKRFDYAKANGDLEGMKTAVRDECQILKIKGCSK